MYGRCCGPNLSLNRTPFGGTARAVLRLAGEFCSLCAKQTKMIGKVHSEGMTMNQGQIDKMLKWGIIFSVIWLAGLGSLASFIIGVKAKRKIKPSDATLTGIGKAWWCIVVGALGVALWLPMILIGFLNQF